MHFCPKVIGQRSSNVQQIRAAKIDHPRTKFNRTA